MKSNILKALAAAAVVATAGCKGTCLDVGERLAVEVTAAANLNDWQGSGPQHVKYRIWALKDVATFEALAAQPETAATLVDPLQDAARVGAGFGLPLAAPNQGWITPGGKHTVPPLNATLDNQFDAVGIVVLFPQPRASVVRVDCDKHVGYEEKEGVHEISFRLDGSTVAPGR